MAEADAPQTDNGFDSAAFLKNLTSRPGVYRMLDSSGTVIYVGKAKNLKKRVASYFRRTGLPPKTRVMVAQIAAIETTVTHTENEALILENNLIKELMPRYNILLRDDKSYPYLFISGDTFPRLSLHRGAKRKKGRYFGPYPSAGAVRDSLNLLQKLFPVRQCEDSYYQNRSRPCLQYQIKRCTAPCVGLVSEAEYQKDIEHTIMFLEGKNQQVMADLTEEMEQASKNLEFEHAGAVRDKIIALRRVQERQYVSSAQGEFDVLAAIVRDGMAVVEVSFIRGGRNLGSKSYFPKGAADSPEELLEAFVPQYYLGKDVPGEILLSHIPSDLPLLEAVLQSESGHKVSLRQPKRGQGVRWMQMVQTNADISLTQRLSSRSNLLQRFETLQDALELDELPKRIECFDISHTRGEKTVASCVVFGLEGAIKADYRKFNIEGITGGDDYAAMNQALSRRFTRLQKGEGKRPDLLLIDGGKGQIKEAQEVLAELNLSDLPILGIAKGPARKPGEETLFLVGRDGEVTLSADSQALHLLQQVRDEAHRFAITGHRQRRGKARKTSTLEQIEGLGPKRRQKLLQQFGGLQEVQRAGVEALANVDGISKSLAQKIYDVFHGDN